MNIVDLTELVSSKIISSEVYAVELRRGLSGEKETQAQPLLAMKLYGLSLTI